MSRYRRGTGRKKSGKKKNPGTVAVLFEDSGDEDSQNPEEVVEEEMAQPQRPAPRNLEYYLVIDFECTCTQGTRTGWKHEIIEFPGVLVEIHSGDVIDRFRSYVKPKEKPNLTNFCTELTGITQAQVNAAPELSVVLEQFDEWLRSHEQLRFEPLNFTVCTDGPWDIESFLYPECKRKRIPFPEYFEEWLDVRDHFKVATGSERRKNIVKMLSDLGMTFEGNPHSGLDDSINIARILVAITRQANLQPNDYVGNVNMKYRNRTPAPPKKPKQPKRPKPK